MNDDHDGMSGLLTDEVTAALDKLVEPVTAGKPIENWAQASTDFIDAIIEIAAELGEERHERLLPPMARECADRATSAMTLDVAGIRGVGDVSPLLLGACRRGRVERHEPRCQ